MVAFSGKRSDRSKELMDAIGGREWGLMLMDEVHVVPARMFRRVIVRVYTVFAFISVFMLVIDTYISI
jgi:hypothetical protein